VNNALKRAFGAISAAFGAIPGLLALMVGLGVPPDNNGLFGAVIECFGGLTLLILWGNRGKLKQVPLSRLTKRAVILGLVGLLFILIYLVIYPICVVTCPRWDAVLVPLWLSEKLASMVAAQGGRSQALCHYGFTSVYQEAHSNPVSLGITLGLLLVIYVAGSTCLTAAFGLFAVRAASTRPPNTPADADRIT
jgi:hypothetical protein